MPKHHNRASRELRTHTNPCLHLGEPRRGLWCLLRSPRTDFRLQILDFRMETPTVTRTSLQSKVFKSAIVSTLPSSPDPRSAYVSVTRVSPERCLPASIPQAFADPAGNGMHPSRLKHLC